MNINLEKQVKVAVIGITGESLFIEVKEFPEIGETISSKSIHYEVGGKGYNQAAMLTKLGAKVNFLSTLGDDNVLDKYTKDSITIGNDAHFIKKVNSKTTSAVIITNELGENRVITSPNPSKLTLDDLEGFKEAILQAEYLLVTFEVPLDVLEASIYFARKNGVKVVLDPAPFNPDFVLYNLCDYIIPNEVEAKQIFLVPKLIELEKLIATKYFINNFKNLIITVGAGGAIHLTKDGIKYYKGANVEVVDTTGAGDVFAASFVYFLGLSNNHKYSIEKAITASALSTTKKYVLNSLPTLEAIDSANLKKTVCYYTGE